MADEYPGRVAGRLVLGDRIVSGRLEIEDGRITSVDEDADQQQGPLVAPGFIDIHIHGTGGSSVLDAAADDEVYPAMSRVLVRHGVTTFVASVAASPARVLKEVDLAFRRFAVANLRDGADLAGLHLEGPFLAAARRGAHDPSLVGSPASMGRAFLDPIMESVRRITIAPELTGALDLIAVLAAEGRDVSLGHSEATLEEAQAGFAAGARSVTHLFNAMSGLDHHAPGLAAAALADDAVTVELIADGIHVHPALLPLVFRMKPAGGVVLVSDALALAGTGRSGRTMLGSVSVEIAGNRAVVAGTNRLAGSVMLLDGAVRTAVAAGVPLGSAIRAATANPGDLLGLADRGRLARGQRADLVVLDNDLGVSAAMRAGRWIV